MIEYIDGKFRSQNPAGDYPEDFHMENGNYSCKCVECGNEFAGHKGRCVCKRCKEAKNE